MKKLSLRRSIRVKITVFFLIIALSITSLLSVILYWQCSKMVTKDIADRASKIVKEASRIINIDEFLKLKTIEDELKSSYINTKDNLDYIRRMSGAKSVFTMRKTDDGKFMYVIDGSSSENMSHLGDIEESDIRSETAWSGQAYTDDKVHYEKKWGALFSSYYPLKDSKGTVVGIIGVDYDAESVYRGLNTFKATCIIVFLASTIIIIISVSIFSKSISKPIKNAVKYSKDIANLDITSEVSQENLKRKDEFGDLSHALYSISDSFKNIIGKISDSSKRLAAASQQFTSTSQESAASIEEVSKAVEEIAKGAAEQAQNTEKGASKAVLLGNIIDNDIEYTKDINNNISNVTKVVNEGFVEIEKLSKITEESNRANRNISGIIQKTNDSSKKIGEASNLIAAIAGQTNLLALNAAIEAARAGEAGKGFAVVADEIKKLAEQSANSTNTIEEMVRELQMNAQNAVDTLERISEISNEQTQSVLTNRNKYKLIEEAMKETEKAMVKLSASGKEIYDLKNEILTTLENLSSIAEENSAATEEVTASMEEETASMEEIANSSENLSQLAKELEDTISKFKI